MPLEIKKLDELYSTYGYKINDSHRDIRLYLYEEGRKPSKSSQFENLTDWEYDIKEMDWLDGQHKKLTNYLPNLDFLAFVVGT